MESESRGRLARAVVSLGFLVDSSLPSCRTLPRRRPSLTDQHLLGRLLHPTTASTTRDRYNLHSTSTDCNYK